VKSQDPDGTATGPEPGSAAAPAAAGTGGAAEPGSDAADSAGVVASSPQGVDGVPAGGKPSGLRNPVAAVRGLGAGTLIIEAVVLLLAIQPIRILGGRLSGAGVATVLGLAVLAVVGAGMMRRRWAWHVGTALQVCLLLAGFLHWSLTALGVIFSATWAYATYVRRSILG
jgi:Protein of unknown function (DUF4233)